MIIKKKINQSYRRHAHLDPFLSTRNKEKLLNNVQNRTKSHRTSEMRTGLRMRKLKVNWRKVILMRSHEYRKKCGKREK